MKRKFKTMDELTENYEKFVKNIQINKNGRQLFSKVLKKAVKQRGSK